MDAIELLHSRNSAAKLRQPAPSGEDLEIIFKAALRAPDHARLRPWRFLTIRGEARSRLGELFVSSAQRRRIAAGESPLSEQDSGKLASKPLRAPLIVIVVAAIDKQQQKVPVIEQILSAGCAAHSILLAAHALGYAGVWRTGGNAYDEDIKRELGLKPDEELVGFLYLGTLDGQYKPLRELNVADFCQAWEG